MYAAGATTSITVIINDDDNDAATGTVSIDVNNKAGMPVDEDDQGNKSRQLHSQGRSRPHRQHFG